jgi:hypothetical protein
MPLYQFGSLRRQFHGASISSPIYSKIENQPNNHSVNFDLNKLERTDKNLQFCIMNDSF